MKTINDQQNIKQKTKEWALLTPSVITLFRIRIDEIIIQMVSYIIDCIIITVLFASSIFCD
jgi:hypothetical protein